MVISGFGGYLMKRFILILVIVLVLATPIFAKDNKAFFSLGTDVTFPTFEFMKDFRGDLTLSVGRIGSSGKGLSMGLYSYNTFRVPFWVYDNDFGFEKVDLKEFTGVYLTSIDGIGIIIPFGSTLDLVLGLGLAAEFDTVLDWKEASIADSIILQLGAGARADLFFNLTDTLFVDFGVEASYLLYEFYYFVDLKDSGSAKINRWNYPSCGLRVGIKF